MSTPAKPLKPYRSKAERIRVWQGWVMILLASSNLTLTTLVLARGR